MEKDLKRPTVRLDTESHKRIEHFRIDCGMKLGEFMKAASLYCVENNINPSTGKKLK